MQTVVNKRNCIKTHKTAVDKQETAKQQKYSSTKIHCAVRNVFKYS